jgi:hypothetical protein
MTHLLERIVARPLLAGGKAVEIATHATQLFLEFACAAYRMRRTVMRRGAAFGTRRHGSEDAHENASSNAKETRAVAVVFDGSIRMRIMTSQTIIRTT